MIWAFGGPILDAKVAFSNQLKAVAQRVKFPENG